MRTDAYTGMFIDGNISAGVSRMEYFYRVTNPTLKSWGYRNAQNDYVPEERTIFKLNEGGFCYNGQFTGSGIYYCNQYAYSAIYGGEIHIKSIKDGFVNDSVELVLPHLNYRKSLLFRKVTESLSDSTSWKIILKFITQPEKCLLAIGIHLLANT